MFLFLVKDGAYQVEKDPGTLRQLRMLWIFKSIKLQGFYLYLH